jgi:hypothetical protein
MKHAKRKRNAHLEFNLPLILVMFMLYSCYVYASYRKKEPYGSVHIVCVCFRYKCVKNIQIYTKMCKKSCH